MSDEKITITVDGVEHQVTPGVQLIEALKECAVDTPHFCYHPDLSIAGNCRMCLVEAEGPRGPALMISCHMRVMPGLKVNTDASSERVRKARQGVMEFLLVNHPLDCPICDKAGECTLQENYMEAGRHESRLEDAVGKVYKGAPDFRFTDTKGQDRGGKNVDLGDTISLDQERCILCSRCVRFMREVAGDEQLYIAGRGDTAYLTTFPGDKLKHDYDLCTTDICPVGALTGKHFRFQQRVWFLKKTESIAPDDSLGANITVEHNKDRVWRLMPRRNVDVNKSWIHNDTRLLYQGLAENRLTTALVDGSVATLSAGYQAAAAAVKKANKVALVASGHLTLEDNQALVALAEALGDKAEVFGGSWLPVAEGDGIARSGDPVANRRSCELLGIADNLDQLTARSEEFDCLVVMGNDLWGAAAAKAAALESIAARIVLSSWHDDSVAKATVAIGVRCWAEVRGVFINCQDRAQLLNACPVCPAHEMDPPWQALCRLSGLAADRPLPYAGELDALKAAGQRHESLRGLSYRAIGPSGVALVPAAEAAEASA
ncbi:MAG: 2Fe-2S iron-sulfur cluster-binding protein [Planctomycetota bacterium]|nr:2Fe-2S iron-sulfur cluster-binding protein [Planctomycetota bacterium]